MATGLNYDELKDHPIEETYKMWARQYFVDPSGFGPQHQPGLNQAFADEGFALDLLLSDPAVKASQDQAQAAQQAAQEAYRQTFAAQRAARAKQRAIARKRLNFKLDTGLRDIGQAREAGLESVVNNALQRGIYRSGIRIENEDEVNRESDEAASDLRRQIDLALQEIAASASAEGASARAQETAFNAEDLQAYADSIMSGAIQAADELWSSPINDPQSVFTPSVPPPPTAPPGQGDFKVPYAPQPDPPGSFYPQLPQPKPKPAVQPTGGPY